MKINLELDLEKVNDLCNICDSSDFDVNIVAGSLIVDGCSVMGVMGLCDRTITIIPVTSDPVEIAAFYERVKPLGAYFVKE